MKLLPKKEIDIHKAKERQQAIEEGLKVAKNIDNLRETKANEERALELFRSETLKQINAEIQALSTDKAKLEKEVKKLQKDKEEALKPLTDLEEKIHLERKELEAEKEEVYNAKRRNEDRSYTLDLQRMEMENKERRIELAAIRTDDELKEASQKNKEAEVYVSIARSTHEKVTADCTAWQEELERNQELLREREQRIFEKEEELRTKEIDLAKEFTVLKDRQALLERNIKRNGKS